MEAVGILIAVVGVCSAGIELRGIDGIGRRRIGGGRRGHCDAGGGGQGHLVKDGRSARTQNNTFGRGRGGRSDTDLGEQERVCNDKA